MNIKIFGGFILLTVAILLGGVFLFSEKETTVPDDQILSRNGLHWHPKLEIFIKGEKQEIPEGIGLKPVEQPIHTHDSSGTIHLELPGLVKKDDLNLGRFFKIWGKGFNSECIFDKCNGEDGKVKMWVNGQENQEFEKYSMRDGDTIEIRYK